MSRVVALAAVFACLFGGVAWADGDPASDVLASRRVFWPYNLAIPAESRAKLSATVEAVTRNGFPVRVAMVSSEYDLGSVGVLFGHPQDYSQFLAQGLANFNRDWVIVVMPDGYGLYRCIPIAEVGACEKAVPTGADERRLRALAPLSRSKQDFAAAAEAAVRTVAEGRGVSADSRGSVVAPVAGACVGIVLVLAVVRWRRRRTVNPS